MSLTSLIKKFGRGMPLDIAAKAVFGLYHKLRDEKSPLRSDLDSKIRNYGMGKFGLDGTIADVAARYNLEDKVQEYLKNNIFGRLQNNFSYLGHLTNYLNNALKGNDAYQAKNAPTDAFVYAVAHKAYGIVSRLLGHTLSHYLDSKKEKIRYFSDIVHHYSGRVGDLLDKFEKFYNLVSRIEEKKEYFAYAAARRAGLWLVKEVARRKGIEEDKLERIIGTAKTGLGSAAQAAKSIKSTFVDYKDLIKTRNPVYGSDLSDRNVYASV